MFELSAETIDRWINLTKEELLKQLNLWSDDIEMTALALKSAADHARLNNDLYKARAIVTLINHLFEQNDTPIVAAVYYMAKGNICIGMGQMELAIKMYREAATLYRQCGRTVDEAKSLVGAVGCLVQLSQYDEAVRLGKQISTVLYEHGEWYPIVKISINLGSMYEQTQALHEALHVYNDAQQLCEQYHYLLELAIIKTNRALILEQLAQFDQAMDDIESACTIYEQLGRRYLIHGEVARVGILIRLGRYSLALDRLNRHRSTINKEENLISCHLDLLHSRLLIQLGRAEEAIKICKQAYNAFHAMGIDHDKARLLLVQTTAYTHLSQHQLALASLDEAKHLFVQEDNHVRVEISNLQLATILYQQQKFADCLRIARDCATFFAEHHILLYEAGAYIMAARSALSNEQYSRAQQYADAGLTIGLDYDVPLIQYHALYLLGQVAHKAGNHEWAFDCFQRSITQLERLREHIIVELQADFLKDKQSVYEDIVLLNVSQNRPKQALHYVERAKSQALLTLMRGIALTLRPRSQADKTLLTEIEHLSKKRTLLYPQKIQQLLDEPVVSSDTTDMTLEEVEQKIKTKWHQLLIRNAAYAQDAALNTIRTEPIQPYLTPDTLLIEYFVAHNDLIIFAITDDAIRVERVPDIMPQLANLSEWLTLNCVRVSGNPSNPIEETAALQQQAKKLLHNLYTILISPIEAQLNGRKRLKIVPHGSILHYLPFQALYDGEQYLIERFEIGYLPSASVLHYLHKREEQKTESLLPCVSFGYSNEGELVAAAEEAFAVSHIMGGDVYTEDMATVDQFKQVCSDAQLIHLSTHGAFNADNPLFSELMLADGAISTYDVFHLRLKASLVTLSACQTGRHVVKGGDELMGLMRAFLYAGASSLLLCLSRAYQYSTLDFMVCFYEQLAAGKTKGEALQQAQCQFIRSENIDARYAHPYYWSPFCLVGRTGHL